MCYRAWCCRERCLDDGGRYYRVGVHILVVVVVDGRYRRLGGLVRQAESPEESYERKGDDDDGEAGHGAQNRPSRKCPSER